MEERMVKFYSKESNKLAMHVVTGHFATSHSHINYYIDVTSIKTRISEAKEAAAVIQSRIADISYADTIVCMDGTEVLGTFLAERLIAANVMSTNVHETLYVVEPEMNNGQMIFRDNMKNKIYNKHVVLLLDTATTGETIRRSMECISYYGGIVEKVISVFSTIESVDGIPVEAIFTEADVPGYQAYNQKDCPFCAKGMRLEAMVNGFGYSML